MEPQEFKECLKSLLSEYRSGKMTQDEMAQKITAVPTDNLIKEDDKYHYDDTDIGMLFAIAWEHDVPPAHRKNGWEKDWKKLEDIVDSW